MTHAVFLLIPFATSLTSEKPSPGIASLLGLKFIHSLIFFKFCSVCIYF